MNPYIATDAVVSVAKQYDDTNAYRNYVKNSIWFNELPSSAKKEISNSGYIERLNRQLPRNIDNVGRARLIVKDLKRIYNEDADKAFKEVDSKNSNIRNSEHYSELLKKLKGRRNGAVIGGAIGTGLGTLVKGSRVPMALIGGATGAGLGYLSGRAVDDGKAFEHSRKNNHITQAELNEPNRILEESYKKYIS